MTSAEFNNLSLEDRAEKLRRVGTYLYEINYYKFKTNLYSFGNLFIEITLDAATDDITDIVIIDHRELEKYLKGIQLGL